MRMSDWSSDVCSSDLADGVIERVVEQAAAQLHAIVAVRAELVGQAAFVEGGCRTGLQVFKNDRRLEFTGADVECRIQPQFAEVVIAVLGIAASYERQRITERTAAGRVQAKARGVKQPAMRRGGTEC